MSSPTQRSKKLLQDDGWTVAIVERWNPHARIRQDLFGFADLLAMKAGETPMLVQVTSGSNVAARKAKILASDHAPVALAGGFRIVIHGWRKVKIKRGKARMKWACRIEEITEGDTHDCTDSEGRE